MRGQCYWHLVEEAREAATHLTMHKTPHPDKVPTQMLIVPRAMETIKRMNAWIKCRTQSRKVENDKGKA